MKAEFFFLITVLQNVKLHREQQQRGANLFDSASSVLVF